MCPVPTFVYPSPMVPSTPTHAHPPLPPAHLPSFADISHDLLATFYPTLSAIMLDVMLRKAEAEEAAAAGAEAAAEEPGKRTEPGPFPQPGRAPAHGAPGPACLPACWLAQPPSPRPSRLPSPTLLAQLILSFFLPVHSRFLFLLSSPADYSDPNLEQLASLLPKDELMRKITQVQRGAVQGGTGWRYMVVHAFNTAGTSPILGVAAAAPACPGLHTAPWPEPMPHPIFCYPPGWAVGTGHYARFYACTPHRTTPPNPTQPNPTPPHTTMLNPWAPPRRVPAAGVLARTDGSPGPDHRQVAAARHGGWGREGWRGAWGAHKHTTHTTHTTYTLTPPHTHHHQHHPHAQPPLSFHAQYGLRLNLAASLAHSPLPSLRPATCHGTRRPVRCRR